MKTFNEKFYDNTIERKRELTEHKERHCAVEYPSFLQWLFRRKS